MLPFPIIRADIISRDLEVRYKAKLYKVYTDAGAN